MRIAILCNGRDLTLWQRRAVETLGREHVLMLLVAEDGPPPRRSLRNALYYALNLVAIRNPMTRRVAFPTDTSAVAERLDFTATFDGAWASFPDAVLTWLRDQRVDVVVKFGLGLLRVPSAEDMPAAILSYHHGDPRHYRGRPAGFYELLQGERWMGQIVQRLSNRLDAGEVLAFADTRVAAHSYRATLIEAYRMSPLLLRKALTALRDGSGPAMAPVGKVYRLPSNLTVVRFSWRMGAKMVARIAYGLFVEKRWRVGLLRHSTAVRPAAAIAEAHARRAEWEIPAVPPRYSFLADPFFEPSGEILVEALNRHSGKGELLRLGDGAPQASRGATGHISYPSVFAQDGRTLILPEICDWAAPAMFSIVAGELVKAFDLDIEPCRLIDPTLVAHEGRLYLFANRTDDGPDVLHLWSAPHIEGRFERHPASPVRISARGSRMAGAVTAWDGQLFRLGQDWRDGYGDGVMVFAIARLSATDYVESEAVEVNFGELRGPHTVNRHGDTLLFDYYEERLSLLAGVRRLTAKLRA